jgi:hypothetical protein
MLVANQVCVTFCKGQSESSPPLKPSTQRIPMSAYNPFLQRALRFCELCGFFVGSMTPKEWDRVGHLCRECEESYGTPGMILMNNGLEPWKTLPTAK